MSETDARLRILLVSHYYPPHVGGIENVVHDEAVRLAAQGHEVVVLTSGERTTTTLEEGVRVVRVRAWYGIEKRAGIPYPLMSPSLAGHALRWAKWADVVHVHDCFYLTSWTARAAAALRRTPMVLTQHVGMIDHPSAAVQGIQRLVYGTAGRLIVRGARWVFTINDRVTPFVIGLGAKPERLSLLDNGVDGDQYRPALDAGERTRIRERHGLPTDRMLALFVGRFVPKKGFDLVLEAADPAYDLVLVGADDDGRAAGVATAHVLGALPKAEVAELYRACDAFVLPSVGEGFPLAVQEAMSSGLPVVTTRDPAYARYGLEDGGVTLIQRDADSVRAALTGLAADEDLREQMGGKAAQYAAARFSWTDHVDTLVRTYRAAMRAGM